MTPSAHVADEIVAQEAVASDSGEELLGEPFRVDSITEVAAPQGGEGIWQRYVIVRGSNTINGLRAGTQAEVSLEVEIMVQRLNDRFRKGKLPPAGSYGRKPPPQAGLPKTASVPPAAK
jgi:hypothetical protein